MNDELDSAPCLPILLDCSSYLEMLRRSERCAMPKVGEVFKLPEKQEKKPEPKERLALALKDMDRMLPEVRKNLLGGKLDLTSIIKAGADRVDSVPAVAFSCDLLEAALVCDNLRSMDRKVGDDPTRIYVLKATAWTLVPERTILTCTDGEKVYLNSEVFNVVLEPVKPTPPKRGGASLPARFLKTPKI